MGEITNPPDYDGPMPVVHGPFEPIKEWRIEDAFEIPDENDWIDYSSNLGRIIRDEQLKLSEVDVQRLYQYERNRLSLEMSMKLYGLCGEKGAAAAERYWSIEDAMANIVDMKEQPDFKFAFGLIVKGALDDEEDKLFEAIEEQFEVEKAKENQLRLFIKEQF